MRPLTSSTVTSMVSKSSAYTKSSTEQLEDARELNRARKAEEGDESKEVNKIDANIYEGTFN